MYRTDKAHVALFENTLVSVYRVPQNAPYLWPTSRDRATLKFEKFDITHIVWVLCYLAKSMKSFDKI